MLRLHKIKSERLCLGERIDFNISHFKALQVPRGWDKLYVTVISVETGKTIARLSKAVVNNNNGSCQWKETLAESVWISPDDSSKELEDCVFKFVVAMGSARSGILGEATVNMASYMSSGSSILVSFPLKKCDYGTVLQSRIQCLTPIKHLRDANVEDENTIAENDARNDLEDAETKSDQETDTASGKSAASYCSSDTGSTTPIQSTPEIGASSSTTNSPRSDDSGEIAIARPGPFPSNLSLERRRGTASTGNGASRIAYKIPDSRSLSRDIQQEFAIISNRLSHSENRDTQNGALRIMDSSQTLLEAAEETIEDLRRQAKMWERTARKLMLEMDFLKKEHVELSRNQANLDMEFSEACAERNGLRKEVELLQQMLMKAKQKPPPLDDSREVTLQLVKELEKEIKFQKQANGNLTMQLKRSQESNIELVAVLQDLEETLEKQKVEIERMYDMETRFGELEEAVQESSVTNGNLKDQILKLQESEKDLLNKVQELQLQLQEGKQKMEDGSPVHDLEEHLKLNVETENDLESLKLGLEGRVRELADKLDKERAEGRRLETELAIKTVEVADLQKYKSVAEDNLSILEKEKGQLEQDLETVTRENEIATRCLNDLQNDLTMISTTVDTHVSVNKNLERKSLQLERSKQELEMCLSELIQEKEDLSTHIVEMETRLRSEASDHESQMSDLEQELKNKILCESNYITSAQELERLKLELEVKLNDLLKQLDESKTEIKCMETTLKSDEEEIRNLQIWKGELEAKLSVIQEEKDQLEQRMEAIMTENDIATRHSNELQSELTMLRTSVESRVATNQILEKKSSELEEQKHDLKQQLSETDQDNKELLMRITDLETQLRSEASDHESQIKYVEENNKKLLMQLDGDYTASLEKVERMRTELEAEVAELKTELSDRKAEIEILDACLHAKEEEVGQLQRDKRESEAKLVELEQEKYQLQQNMDTVMGENAAAAGRLNDLENDNMMLRSSLDSHVASNNALETKYSDLEYKQQELELQLSELKREKQELSTCFSGLETQLRSEASKSEELMEIIEEKEKELREALNRYNDLSQELESTKENMRVKALEHTRDVGEKMAEIKGLESMLQIKEEEIGNLQMCSRESESELLALEKEKCQLEQYMDTIVRENGDAKDLIHVLLSSFDPHATSKEVLERSSNLESDKQETQGLSSCIFDLEAKIGLLKIDRESIQLDLENSKAGAATLQDEVAKLRNEIEAERMNMNGQLLHVNNEWLIAQEEIEHLKDVNKELQAKTEGLTEEQSASLKANEELQEKNMDLQNHCSHVQEKLNGTQSSLVEFSERVMVLEDKIVSLEQASASKVEDLTSELDQLHDKYEEQIEKLRMLSELHSQEITEFENLQQQIEALTEQLSAAQEEKQIVASPELQEKANPINIYEMEGNMDTRSLMDELTAFKENQKRLEADNRRMLHLLEEYKSFEEKFRTKINDLELKLTVSEYERQVLKEEAVKLKAQLLKVGPAYEEVLELRSELSATKSEKEKLKTSLHLITEECQQLEVERGSLSDQIASLQKLVSELEDQKRNKVLLEEKLKIMERDLMTKEALCERDKDLSNELGKIRNANKNLQKRIQELEDEKEDYLARARSLEEELVMMQEELLSQNQSSSMDFSDQKDQKENEIEGKILENNSEHTASIAGSFEEELSKARSLKSSLKVHSKRFTSDSSKKMKINDSPRKPLSNLESLHKERTDCADSSLERELRDIRERYLEMSLKYAEVEAQREELVMKLRTTSNGKILF
ncbi:unnamed protein product [Linum trigynum]|uniref:C2 NT-type domain-containing protein n=1 Tax=Linum trigynum TaxID=586398 RepID=A0AAV2DAR8_9ROSI